MTRYVADAAAMLTVIAGSDPADPMTAQANAHKTDYVAALDARSLQGARIGVLRMNQGRSSQTDQVFETALAAMKAAGAVLVEVKGRRRAHPHQDLRRRGRGPADRIQGRAERLPRRAAGGGADPHPSTT